MKKVSTAAFMLILSTGCYHKYLVLQAEAVSMTKSDAGAIKHLHGGEEVSEKWCVGDQPLVTGEDHVVGLADQVIYKAQDGGRRADFITEVQIFHDSNSCALLTGKLAKM